jgi:hypothetical protein
MTTTPSTLSYQTAAPPLLRHPVLACSGFTLFTIAALGDWALRLAHLLHVPLPRFSLWFYLGTHLLMITGALFVVHAFRRSATTSRTLRIALIAAIWIYAVGFILDSLVVLHPDYFSRPFSHASPGIYFGLLFFQTAAFVPVLILWLALLVRIGIVVDSRAFLVFATLTLAARLITALAWTAFYIYYVLLILHGPLPSIPGSWQDTMNTTARYTDILSAPLLIALSIWCIFLMPPLAKKSAPLSCAP